MVARKLRNNIQGAVMIRTKRRALGLALGFLVIGAVAAIAGPPWISIEYPVNPFDAGAKDGYLKVRTYHHSDLVGYQIAGTAEGLVNGRRTTSALDINPLNVPGTYVVNWKKPATGDWILLISTKREGEHMATAVVKVDQEGRVAQVSVPYRIIENGRWKVPRAVASSEVDAMLRGGSILVLDNR